VPLRGSGPGPHPAHRHHQLRAVPAARSADPLDLNSLLATDSSLRWMGIMGAAKHPWKPRTSRTYSAIWPTRGWVPTPSHVPLPRHCWSRMEMLASV